MATSSSKPHLKTAATILSEGKVKAPKNKKGIKNTHPDSQPGSAAWLIAKLQALKAKHGNMMVMFNDPNHDSIFSINAVRREKVEGDWYPEDWDMPEGFEYFKLDN